MTPEHAIETLERTPRILRSLLEGLGEHYTHANYGPDTFSPFDVVGHLIHGEKTDWLPRIRFILEHAETESFEPFDRYAQQTASRGKTMLDLLDEFEQRRGDNMEALRALGLTDNQLAARGVHPELGAITIENLLAAWVVHDLHHIAQICKAMGRQHTDEVGPFRAFIGILNDPCD